MKRKTLFIVAAVSALVAGAATLLLTRADDEAAPHPHGWAAAHPGSVGLPAHPRVAAPAPGISQILRDLGCADLIVARHAYDKWSRQSLPVCGDQQGVDYEKLIETNPTHVFVQLGEQDLPERLKALARERGWVVRNVPLLTLDDVAHATVALSAAVVTPELDALRAENAALRPTEAPSARQMDRETRLQAAQNSLLERLDKAYARDAGLSGAGACCCFIKARVRPAQRPNPRRLGRGRTATTSCCGSADRPRRRPASRSCRWTRRTWRR
ncbi:MAG: hypothetical protein QM783_19115 [Phycisphaerales bacterium]